MGKAGWSLIFGQAAYSHGMMLGTYFVLGFSILLQLSLFFWFLMVFCCFWFYLLLGMDMY